MTVKLILKADTFGKTVPIDIALDGQLVATVNVNCKPEAYGEYNVNFPGYFTKERIRITPQAPIRLWFFNWDETGPA